MLKEENIKMLEGVKILESKRFNFLDKHRHLTRIFKREVQVIDRVTGRCGYR